jgi:beta-lactamase superfamily II metal-dependent hydrolase
MSTVQYHIFFLNVGQGEGTFIVKREIPDSGDAVCTTLLVDTDRDIIDTVQLVKDSIPKVKKDDKDVHFLDAMVITHPHDDHIGGLDSYVNDSEIKAGKIFHPDYDFVKSKDTKDYKAYDKLRKDSSNQSETRLVAGTDYGNDTGIKFTALSPPKTIEDADKFKDQSEKIQVHNQCAVISVDLNGTKVLFLGDANQECIKRLMQYHKEKLPAHILSASHHGSNSIFVPESDVEASLADVKRGEHADWDEAFLDTIDPSYVVISCGEGNTYKHPHSAALEAYKSNRTVKRTDNHDTLYFVIDADGSCADPTSLKTYKEVKDKIKSLFPGNAGSDDSVSGFFITGSALPVTPRNS